MPADDVDPELLIDAILLHVADLGDGGGAWLQGEFDRVLADYLAGAVFTTGVTFKGQSSSQEQTVRVAPLLAQLTQARKRLSEETTPSNATGAMLIPRFTEFPL